MCDTEINLIPLIFLAKKIIVVIHFSQLSLFQFEINAMIMPPR
jgi:hypothetical protein